MRGISRRALAASALLPWAVRAQENWPSRPVRWVVPFPPGGGVDIVSRLIAARLTETQTRPFVIENIAGGSGVVGASAVARAEPDGHTLLMQTYSSAVVNPVVMRQLPYDPMTALTPVSLVAVMPMLLVVHPALPARNIEELLALLKANPGRYNYGSAGPRTLPHLAAALFAAQAGVQIEHVAYRGTGPAAQALLTGEISLLVDSIAAQSGHLRAGTSRPIAVLARTRSPLLPDVPTLVELGQTARAKASLAFYTSAAAVSRSIIATPGIPEERVRALRNAFNAVQKDPDFLAEIAKTNSEFDPASGEYLQELALKIAATPQDILADTSNALRER
jgi:tripartite-type tricarboxylate transporter receptor subunit TctC